MAQTGQSEAIHSPEACAKTVLRPIREDKRGHHVVRDALRSQRREDWKAPVGGFDLAICPEHSLRRRDRALAAPCIVRQSD